MSHPFKQLAPTDHFGWHKGYMEFYHSVLRGIADFPGAVGELGCDGGGGILSYADYFKTVGYLSPRQFVSFDIAPRPPALDLNPAIIHHQLNAYDPRGVETAAQYGPYIALFEDGPHTLGTQEYFVEHYLSLLAPEGMAFVEDIQERAHIKQLHAKLPPGFIGYSVDLRLADNRYDSLLFVAQRL